MSKIIVNIESMSDCEFAQAWDLLKVADVSATSTKNPLESNYDIQINLANNKHKLNKLDDALGFIALHIVKN